MLDDKGGKSPVICYDHYSENFARFKYPVVSGVSPDHKPPAVGS